MLIDTKYLSLRTRGVVESAFTFSGLLRDCEFFESLREPSISSLKTSKSCDVCQLRIKPLSLKFRPRYEAAGDEFWRAGLQLASMASSQQVSCDWRISRHVTTTLISDWSAGGGGVRCHAEGGSVLRPCRAVHQVRMFKIFVYS